MKKIRKHLKIIAIILCISLLVQSCRVYRSNTISITEAVNNSKNVKIKDGNKKYKFKFLSVSENKFYGYTNKNSKTAKLLSEQIVETNLKYGLGKIELQEEQLKSIHPVNITLSITLSLLVTFSPYILAAILSLLGVQLGFGVLTGPGFAGAF